MTTFAQIDIGGLFFLEEQKLIKVMLIDSNNLCDYFGYDAQTFQLLPISDNTPVEKVTLFKNLPPGKFLFRGSEFVKLDVPVTIGNLKFNCISVNGKLHKMDNSQKIFENPYVPKIVRRPDEAELDICKTEGRAGDE